MNETKDEDEKKFILSYLKKQYSSNVVANSSFITGILLLQSPQQ